MAELNIRSNGSIVSMENMERYWESEAPRIGDAHPSQAGLELWLESQTAPRVKLDPSPNLAVRLVRACEVLVVSFEHRRTAGHRTFLDIHVYACDTFFSILFVMECHCACKRRETLCRFLAEDLTAGSEW